MAEDEIIKKHTKAVYSTWKDPNKNWLHKLKDILLEVVIIVFAVSVSIWLHNWSEERKDRKEEKAFFEGLRQDIKSDIKEMQNDIVGLEWVLQGAKYFATIGTGANPDKDSVAKYQNIFFVAAQINPRISRFEALKGSGKLDIIEDKKKLYNIIDLYQKIFPNIFRLNPTFNALNVDKIDPYIGDNLKIAANGEFLNTKEVLGASKIRLLLTQLAGAYDNSIQAYTRGVEKSNEIIKQLDEEIE